ncbi:MAG: GIY-YIG nuclease family protein [Gemmataceae bacterium]|nr:GIY-YIG nuclease family protein [Gemmataceae bacterium]
MIDPRGRLHYVGKAKNLRSRLLSYFRVNSRDDKAGRIVNQARAVVWEEAPNEFAALLRELELIRAFCPPYNVVGQPGRRRFTYLHLGRKPAPYFFRSAELNPKALATYGPLPGGRRLGDAVRRLNDLFRLRDCPQTVPLRFADQQELFPISEPAACLRYDINRCHGPCVAAVTRRTYSRSVKAAMSFLNGEDMETLMRLRQSMSDAASVQEFERAAMLRDTVDELFWLQERLAWLQNARREYSFVYPVAGVWYLIRGGRVLASVVEPTNVKTRRIARRAIDAVFPPGGGPSIIPNDLYDHVMLVSGWFRRLPLEQAKALTPDDARLRCDGVAAVA